MTSHSLYFTIGLPRSGKSTQARKWLAGEIDIKNNKFIDEFACVSRFNNVPRIVVTPDAWRLALGHRYNWYAEPVVFAHVQIAVRALLQDYDVLVDDTHTTTESIKRILEVEPMAHPVLVDTPVEVCIERAISSGQKDLADVIKRMNTNIGKLWLGYHLPELKELRSEVIHHSSRKIVV
jgi:hypothetical protein